VNLSEWTKEQRTEISVFGWDWRLHHQDYLFAVHSRTVAATVLVIIMH
jgi:hypothetical protein